MEVDKAGWVGRIAFGAATVLIAGLIDRYCPGFPKAPPQVLAQEPNPTTEEERVLAQASWYARAKKVPERINTAGEFAPPGDSRVAPGCWVKAYNYEARKVEVQCYAGRDVENPIFVVKVP